MGYPSEDHEVIDRLQRVIGQTNRDKGFREDWELATRLEELAERMVNLAVTEEGKQEIHPDAEMLHKAAKALRINILGMKIALIHSEASEMLSDLRDYGTSVEFSREGVDVIIRTLDLLDMNNDPAGKKLVEKMRENKMREYKHGRQA